MSVVIFNNTFDENALPLSNITLRRAKYYISTNQEPEGFLLLPARLCQGPAILCQNLFSFI